MSKQVLIYTILVALILSIAGCGGGGDSITSSSITTQNQPLNEEYDADFIYNDAFDPNSNTYYNAGQVILPASSNNKYTFRPNSKVGTLVVSVSAVSPSDINGIVVAVDPYRDAAETVRVDEKQWISYTVVSRNFILGGPVGAPYTDHINITLTNTTGTSKTLSFTAKGTQGDMDVTVLKEK